mgnify:CR=1 FL=1
MANKHRGEIEARLDDKLFRLVLTLGALAELVRIDMRHVVVGWCANFALWLMLALSFWAALRGVLPAAQVPLSEFPFYLASVALAMVAGCVTV